MKILKREFLLYFLFFFPSKLIAVKSERKLTVMGIILDVLIPFWGAGKC